MIENLVEIHEELYLFLEQLRNHEPNLRYSFRKSNHSNRLEEGYWFYGNEEYLAISFWTGMDWKNRTPNIVWLLDRNGETRLEFNVSDSNQKRLFVEKYFLNRIQGLSQEGRRYVKTYLSDSNYSNSLEAFLKTDKILIDDIINEFNELHFGKNNIDQIIKPIPKQEFTNRLKHIKKYRELKATISNTDDFAIKENRPGKLDFIRIKNFGKIKDISLEIHDRKNQWVFVTGENGSGKTLLLRAISVVLGNKLVEELNYLFNDDEFEATADLVYKNDIVHFTRTMNHEAKRKKVPVVQGLAMYGPYRLDIVTDRTSRFKYKKKLGKIESFESLFEIGKPLLGLAD